METIDNIELELPQFRTAEQQTAFLHGANVMRKAVIEAVEEYQKKVGEEIDHQGKSETD